MSLASAEDAGTKIQAITTICVGVFFMVVNDAMAKWLTEDYGALQIYAWRSMMALPIIATMLWATRGRAGFTTASLRTHALRGFFAIAAAWCFFTSLKQLTLAGATSLVFAAPLFITALSVVLLGEKVGWRRWSAVTIGFFGVLVIVRPGGETFQTASIYAVGAAFFYALFMISARWIKREEPMMTMMFYVSLFPLIYCTPVLALDWQPIASEHLLLFLGMAVFGTTGITMIGHAFRLAPAAIVAPFDYTALLWATVLGFMFWGDLPDLWTYVGALIIIASGIYIVLREARAG
ncbi:DMT family transporter [Nitratireductor basaltis]|uniref:EamA domain-containing protein n=1 Tax=Nitratireductor basaltis TaxID=472175 RepID=A0A084U8I7_9HYPH|nr:DMT family transporter [Nitratireductor basaltis]KFB09273.1 hypothetical protein EL18_00288 [Nitratireductor basaltis]